MFILQWFLRKRNTSDKTAAADKEKLTDCHKCQTKSDTQHPKAKNKTSKPRWCWPLFCFKRNHRVAPAESPNFLMTKTNSTKEIKGEQPTQKLSTVFSHHDKTTVMEQIKQDKTALSAKENKKKSTGKLCARFSEENKGKQVMDVSSRPCPLSYMDMCLFDSKHTKNTLESLPDQEEFYSLVKKILNWYGPPSFKDSWRTTDPLGFPNLGNTCYMNSSLQSLLTIKDFVKSISRTEQIWRSDPQAQLLKKLIDIRDCHKSTNANIKIKLLQSFKDIISDQNPQFMDNEQNDAHEFLISVLTQIQSLSPLLQHTGAEYTCPVEENFGFKMEYTRTCKKCGVQSVRQEQFNNLSLDLVPGGSIEDMIEKYVQEVELEYSCDCGGKSLGQTLTFASLPKTLIIHLKRFSCTSSFNLKKIYEPVHIQRDLIVSSKMGGGCFSLVSAISHLGNTGNGHYICDSIHPEDCPLKPTDHWLTFNDSMVLKTSGWDICKKRQEMAYILFYRRHI